MALPTPGSPVLKIKDEPMDEEYEKAFGPQAPAGKIKEEPDTSEVRISVEHFNTEGTKMKGKESLAWCDAAQI